MWKHFTKFWKEHAQLAVGAGALLATVITLGGGEWRNGVFAGTFIMLVILFASTVGALIGAGLASLIRWLSDQ